MALKPTNAPRLNEIAYERILEGLFARRVQVGAFLSQGALSELVDVPIAPLRDALRMLEAEGVLTIPPVRASNLCGRGWS